MAKKTKRWVPTIGAKLGPQENMLRNALRGRGAVDVRTLFAALMVGRPRIVHALLSLRQKHQKIGAVAARHNRKVKTPHIVKGDKAGTYRLKRVR